MKRIRLETWGSRLLPRTRYHARPPCYLIRQQQYIQPHNHSRLQSTAAVSSIPDTEGLDVYPTPRLEDLPSPPVSASLQSAKLAALHARLSLPHRFPIQTLARTLVDPSADSNPSFNNASLSILGSDLLGYYTSEHFMCRYPRIPQIILFAAQYAYVGPKALASVAREWGIESAAEPGGEVDPGLLQYRALSPGSTPEKTPKNPRGKFPYRRGVASRTLYRDQFGDSKTLRPDATHLEAASYNFVNALFGALYLHAGRAATKRFHQSHILSRHLNLSALFDFRQPARDLARLCLREGFLPPVARMISETGRHSRHPVFVVGVYSGKDKLGEGQGASLNEARTVAAANALKVCYIQV
ncbi:ribonuclease III [Patellaria atrata CBS 101060]|uniref:Large ribosomal subunit protein mL44 n=1 Tax=Patellaria atrata CBS 101060 TaxID=1346257 RepID=A0A9P4SIU5_9PEZI|nr:ribonuclease III [Patellaria atrata CBS 101060]